MKRSVILVSFAMFALAACSDDSSNGNNPNIINPTNNTNATNNTNNTNSTNNTNNVDPDMGTDVDMASTNNNNNTQPDMDFTCDVATPGVLHGDWTVTVIEGDPSLEGPVAVFSICHEDGETDATGTFESEKFGVSGNIGTTNYVDDVFSSSMTFQQDGDVVTFNIAAGSLDDANTINGSWSFNATGTFGEVQLTRVQ